MTFASFQLCHEESKYLNSSSANFSESVVVAPPNTDELVDLEAPFHELGLAAVFTALLYLSPMLLPDEMPGEAVVLIFCDCC